MALMNSRAGENRREQKDDETRETVVCRTTKKKNQQKSAGNKGVKEETPNSQSIPHVTVRLDQDLSSSQGFPIIYHSIHAPPNEHGE